MTGVSDPVSEVLGIGASGPPPLMSAVENGLPLASLDRVVDAVAPSDTGFAFRIIPRATLARRRKAFAPIRDRGWDAEDCLVSKAFGEAWRRSMRSLLLIVPSVVARMEHDPLISDAHPEARQIAHGPHAPIW
jgi:hypothetical protein